MFNLLGGKVTFTIIAVLGVILAALFFWTMHLQSKNGAQKKEIQKLTEDLNLIRKEVEVKEASLKASNESLAKMVTENETMATKHTQEKRDLEARLKSVQEEAKAQKRELENLRAENKKLAGAMDQKKIELESLRASLAGMQPGSEAEALKKQIEEKEKEYKAMQERAAEYEKTIEKIRNELAAIDCLKQHVPQSILRELFRLQ